MRGVLPPGMSRLVCAAMLLAATAAACSEGATPRAASPEVGAAAEKSPAAAAAQAVKSMQDVTSLRYGLTGTVVLTGHVDAEVAMTTQPWAMSMEVTAERGTAWRGPTEFRFIKDIMYVKNGTSRRGQNSSKRWTSAAPGVWGRGAVENRSFGLLPSELSMNPITQSTLLTASKDLRRTGTATVDGTSTTRYSGTVVSDAVEGDRLDQLVGLWVTGTLTTDMWIDDSGHLKQYRLRGEHAPNTVPAGAGGPLDLTITFHSIDQALTIKPPARNDTTFLGDARQG
ncbi:LppX_LprAFG lipoprotein [Streptomyces sp. NPDC090106]|uniref:LppX_LprAFG lipoprotein n=1 Tax=Streptomyces sp. NPDC090106 TaxID=3365946 RepID=UPI00380767AD